MIYDREYGARGRIGIITPQANPTVEPEIGVLLPPGVSMVVARATSDGESPQRLRNYFEQLGDTLQHFDTLPLDAVGFACTGSSYLLGRDWEHAQLETLEKRYDYPIVSAAGAIDDALRHLGARRVALACPYPQWLLDAAHEFWAGLGYEIATAGSAQAQSGDTRSIYALGSDQAENALRQLFDKVEADVLLITGTGMPSLRLVAQLSAERQLPVLSSNLCLAWRCLQRAEIASDEHAPDAKFPLLSGWQDQLQRL